MRAFNDVIKDFERKMKTEPLYNLRYKLWIAMKNDLGVMAEHNDDDISLLKELRQADEDILQAYREIFL